jgi:hypothetical protein
MLTLNTLQQAAQIMRAVRDELPVDRMSLDSLDQAMDAARDIEDDCRGVIQNISDAQWARPEHWKKAFRDDGVLYKANEAVSRLHSLRNASGSTPVPWEGYVYELEEDKTAHVLRIFADSVRDVVPASEALLKARPRHENSLFDDRADCEKVALDLEMTLLEYLTTQTNEKHYEVLALCFQ